MTKNIKIEELINPSQEIDNPLIEIHKDRLGSLATKVLQTIRVMIKKPIHIIEGYDRFSEDEQISIGEAVIFSSDDKATNEKIFFLVRDNLEFDCMINNSNYESIYISYTERRPNRQIVK